MAPLPKQSLDTDTRIRIVRVGANCHKFFATPAGQNVRLSQNGGRHSGERAQHIVADSVTVGVIDLFEKIQIKHNERKPLSCTQLALNGDGTHRVTLDQATTVMHLGDADAAENHYTPYQVVLQSKTTDAAFVPTWILSSASGRRVLQQIIKPVQAIGIHVEDKHRASAAKFRKELDADAFVDPGETRVLQGNSR